LAPADAPERPSGRISKPPRAVSLFDFSRQEHLLIVDGHARSTNLDDITFLKVDLLIRQVRRRPEMDLDCFGARLQRQVGARKTAAPAVAGKCHGLDGTYRAPHRRFRLRVVHRRGWTPPLSGLREHARHNAGSQEASRNDEQSVT
jgi:hypothetical protein